MEWGARKVPDVLSSWDEAFDCLEKLLKSSCAKQKVLFLDEMPWMETPNSGFLKALDHFWNSFATAHGCKAKGAVYQLIDNFTLFHFRFIADKPNPDAHFWMLSMKDGFLRVALVDATGRPVAGRQLVEIEVRDPTGAVHDETGRYAMTGGRVKIPLRYAKDDPSGSLFSKWKACARELTTGCGDSVSWTR